MIGKRVRTKYGKGTVVQKIAGDKYPWLVKHDSGFWEQFKRSEPELI